MSSVPTLPRFLNTHPTPSKVLHLKNLPWDCTEGELIKAGSPFGTVVNTARNLGVEKNEALIEFENQNQAIAMIKAYESPLKRLQIRETEVSLQFSKDSPTMYNKTTADVPGKVLSVIVEGNNAQLVSIDVLRSVFLPFGFVPKITTSPKEAGLEALVQFTDFKTAASVMKALGGKLNMGLIPGHEHCSLKITNSNHVNLLIKSQSNCSRDYTNPMLPVDLPIVNPTGSQVLHVSFENMQYAVTMDVLHRVFSSNDWEVRKIAMFYDEDKDLQALIQYRDVQTAVFVKEALDGHCLYYGEFSKLNISYSCFTDLCIKVNNHLNRDYTNAPAQPNQMVGGKYRSLPGGPGGRHMHTQNPENNNRNQDNTIPVAQPNLGIQQPDQTVGSSSHHYGVVQFPSAATPVGHPTAYGTRDGAVSSANDAPPPSMP